MVGGEIGLGTGGELFGGGEGIVKNGLVTKNKDDDEDEEDDDEEDEAEDELDEGEDAVLTAVNVATNKTWMSKSKKNKRDTSLIKRNHLIQAFGKLKHGVRVGPTTKTQK